MADFVELAVQFAAVALGALVGSGFMWLVLGPIIAQRGMRRFTAEAWDLTEDETKDPRAMIKAITQKQTASMKESFEAAFNGALGPMIRDAPTEKLEALAQQYGFQGVDDAKAKLLGGQAGGSNPLALLGSLGGNPGGRAGAFSRIAELMALAQAFGAIGGSGALGMSEMPGVGGQGARVW